MPACQPQSRAARAAVPRLWLMGAAHSGRARALDVRCRAAAHLPALSRHATCSAAERSRRSTLLGLIRAVRLPVCVCRLSSASSCGRLVSRSSRAMTALAAPMPSSTTRTTLRHAAVGAATCCTVSHGPHHSEMRSHLQPPVRSARLPPVGPPVWPLTAPQVALGSNERYSGLYCSTRLGEARQGGTTCTIAALLWCR